MGLRSYLHPLIFTPGFWLLRTLALDTPWAVQLAPRLVQVVLSLAHDAAANAFVRTYFPAALRTPAALVYVASWFCAFVHTRTFSNSLEATLYLVALTAWPITPAHIGSVASFREQTRWRLRRAGAVACAGLACVLRPTAAALVLPVAVWELALCCPRAALAHRLQHAASFVLDGGALAAAFLLVNAAIDRAFYGRWVAPAWVNLSQNVLQNVSALYGEHPWHWYASQGVPAMLASLLPLVIFGLWHAAQRRGVAPLWPAALAAWGIAVHSAVPHKEFRFVLPSVELLLPYAAVPLLYAFPGLAGSRSDGDVGAQCGGDRADCASAADSSAARDLVRPRRRGRAAGGGTAAAAETTTTNRHVRGTLPPQLRSNSPPCWARWVVGSLVALQAPVLAYFGLVHQRGTIAAAEWLAGARFGAVCTSSLAQLPSNVMSYPRRYALDACSTPYCSW